MRTRNKPRPATVFGIDVGKNLFHVVGLDAAGMPIQKAIFRRDTLLQFFERAGPALVGMEACSGSQWLARGHGAHRSHYPSSIREAICEVEQK